MRTAGAVTVSLVAGLAGIWLFVFPVQAGWDFLLEPQGWVSPRSQPVNNDDERFFSVYLSILTLAWVALWGLASHRLLRHSPRHSPRRAALWALCTLCLLTPFLFAMFGPAARASNW